MALLTDIRRYSDSTVARLVFAAVVIVFVFWGVGTAGMGPQAQTLAYVNSKRIIDSDLQRLMRLYTRQNQGSMNEAELKELQAQVLDELILQEALLQEAERLKIEVSDKELSFQILQTEAFKGPDGKFNKELYDRVLKSDGLSQAKFESQLRQDLTLRKLRSLVLDSVELPDAVARSRFNDIATEVEVRYVNVSAAQFTEDVEVTASEIQAELQDNDADIRTQYDEDLTRLYQLPERYRIERIVKNIGSESDVAALRAELEAAREAHANGEQFGALALQYSESTQPLTPLSAAQLGPEAVTALEAVQDGELTTVVETTAGLQLIKRLAKLPAQETSFDEAKEDIARIRLKEKKSPQLAQAFADSILSQWQSGNTPPESTLASKNIRIETPEAFPKGNSAIPGLSGNIAFETAIKDLSTAGLIQQVFAADGAFFIVEITKISPPSDEDFQTIGRYYTAQMKTAQKQSALEAWNQEILAKAKVEKIFNPITQ